MVNETVGKQPVCKKGSIRIVDKEVSAIVIHIIDRFRVIGVLFASRTDVAADHVMKGLKYVAYYQLRT